MNGKKSEFMFQEKKSLKGGGGGHDSLTLTESILLLRYEGQNRQLNRACLPTDFTDGRAYLKIKE